MGSGLTQAEHATLVEIMADFDPDGFIRIPVCGLDGNLIGYGFVRIVQNPVDVVQDLTGHERLSTGFFHATGQAGTRRHMA